MNKNKKIIWIVAKIIGALLVCYMLFQLLRYSLTGTVAVILPAGFATVMFVVRSLMADYEYRHPMSFRLLLVMVGILGIFVFLVPCLQLTEYFYWETKGMITPAYCFFMIALFMVVIFLWSLRHYRKHIVAGKEKSSRPYALIMAFSIAIFFGQGLASISAHQNIEQQNWESSWKEI